MDESRDHRADSIEERGFVWLLLMVSAAFAAIVWPFFGAILWGTVFAILFAPLFRRLKRGLRNSGTLAATATLAIVVAIVIVPLIFLAASLANEASGVYERIRSGEVSFGRYFRQMLDALPSWARSALERVGLDDVGSVQTRLSASAAQASQFLARQAINIGQNALEFLVSLVVMLYLLFFLLRDGEGLYARLRAGVPLRADRQRALFSKFAVVVRATVKGNVVIAILQGALGGFIFWVLGVHAPLLWAVVMAFLSLLPAVGTALVWLPVALYFLATGAWWSGVVLMLYGIFVIGLVDNVVRPILVGKDTKMPDYVVLISTLGGLAVFGPNGFVIGPLIAALFIASWDLFAASRS
jgi:predicted PurR-regulated permease PerM